MTKYSNPFVPSLGTLLGIILAASVVLLGTCTNKQKCYVDIDRDGYGTGESVFGVARGKTCPIGQSDQTGDCNDHRTSTHPYGTETCDTVDNDCNGAIDDGVNCSTGN